MDRKTITVFIHRLYYDDKPKKGGLDLIIDFLLEHDYTIYLAEFPLNYAQSRKHTFKRVTKSETELLEEFTTPTPRSSVNWLLEVIHCIFWSLKYKLTSGIVFSADPLMALPAVLINFKFHYYHSVDYSPVRFSNSILNFIYLKLLFFGMKRADLVGVVTKRALDRLSYFKIKNMLYIPNSPSFDACRSYYVEPGNREKSLVITCAEISDKYKVLEVCNLFCSLNEKYPELRLNLIGYYDDESDYVTKIKSYLKQNKLTEKVVFHGYNERGKNLSIIGKSYLGLAFYDDKQYSHVIFGDSLKMREYAVLGLPIVADASTSTAYEMSEEQAGFMVLDSNEAEERISSLLDDFNLYNELSQNSLEWAKKVDKAKILDNFLTKIEKV